MLLDSLALCTPPKVQVSQRSGQVRSGLASPEPLRSSGALCLAKGLLQGPYVFVQGFSGIVSYSYNQEEY